MPVVLCSAYRHFNRVFSLDAAMTRRALQFAQYVFASQRGPSPTYCTFRYGLVSKLIFRLHVPPEGQYTVASPIEYGVYEVPIKE